MRVGPMSKEVPGRVAVGLNVTVGLAVTDSSTDVTPADVETSDPGVSVTVGLGVTVAFPAVVVIEVSPVPVLVEGASDIVSFRETVGVTVGPAVVEVSVLFPGTAVTVASVDV